MAIFEQLLHRGSVWLTECCIMDPNAGDEHLPCTQANRCTDVLWWGSACNKLIAWPHAMFARGDLYLLQLLVRDLCCCRRQAVHLLAAADEAPVLLRVFQEMQRSLRSALARAVATRVGHGTRGTGNSEVHEP